MNVLCPNCQKMQSVPDSLAGQSTTCTNCKQTFPVPTLPQPVYEPAGTTFSTPVPPTPPKSSPTGDAGADIYNISLESPAVESRPKSSPVLPPLQPKREKSEPAASPLPSREKLNAAAMPAATDYLHHSILMVRPAAVALVAPIALLLVIVFWFFSWTGAFPGGHAVYTQSALQALYGGHTTNPVGEKVFHLDSKLTEKLSWNGLMLLYVLATLGALAFVLAPMLTSPGRLHLPPRLERIWPWRWLIALALAVIALLLLGVQSSLGFGLESAVGAVVRDDIAQLKLPADTPEEQQIVELNAGKIAGSLDVHRTWWWRLALVANLAAVLGLTAEWFLHRRTSSLPPRADFHW